MIFFLFLLVVMCLLSALLYIISSFGVDTSIAKTGGEFLCLGVNTPIAPHPHLNYSTNFYTPGYL